MTTAHIPAAVGDRCVPWCPACRAEEAKETTALAPEPQPPPKRKRELAVWREMTVGEEQMAEALGRCKIPSGFAKRFARDVEWQTRPASPRFRQITEKQAAWLRKLVHTYRRQIAPALLVFAGEGPDARMADLMASHKRARGRRRALFAEQMVALDAAMEAGRA